MNRVRILLFVLLLGGLIAGCSSGGGGRPGAAANELVVQDAWGRTSPMVAQNGAFYMKVVNGTSEDDSLLSASSDACDVVELHEMYMKEEGVMGMRPVEGGEILVPAGQTVDLKPGGLHVMCIGKTADFNVGDTYTLDMEFEGAGSMPVTVEIRESGDMPANMDMEHDGEEMDMEEKSE